MKTKIYYFGGILPKAITRSPSVIICLLVCRLYPSSEAAVSFWAAHSKSQYHQPLYRFLSGFPLVGGQAWFSWKPFSSYSHSWSGRQPWAQHCSHWCSHFPTHSSLMAKLPWCIFHDHPHPRSLPSGDNIRPSLFVKMGIHRNPFESWYVYELSRPQWKIKYW